MTGNDGAAAGYDVEASAPQGDGGLGDRVTTGVRLRPLKATACDDGFCAFVLQNGVDARAGETGRGGGYIRVKRTLKSSYKNMYFI